MKKILLSYFKFTYSISIILAIFPAIVHGQYIIAGMTGSNEIYTDIADTTFIHSAVIWDPYEQNYFFDIDNDGVNDFKLTLFDKFWNGSAAAYHEDKVATINPLHSNASVATMDTTYYCIACPTFLRKLIPKLFNIGDTIFNSFFNSDYSNPYLINVPTAYFWNDTWSDGYHSPMGNKYVGVKLQYSDTTILSWIHVDIQYQTITLFDYSYAIGSSIGLEENYLKNLSLYPNPTSGIINIDLGKVKTNIKATLTNSIGEVVLTKNYASTNYINLDLNYPKGLYFLSLETQGEVISKKIVLQ